MAQARQPSATVSGLHGYTPFQGLDRSQWHGRAWEVVCVVYPGCDGECAHCWSAEASLGAAAPAAWHARFWPKVDPARVESVRITGGEPLLHTELGEIVRVVRRSLGALVPIKVLTSARPLISFRNSKPDVESAAAAILRSGLVLDNLEIQMSADELHGPSMARRAGQSAASSCEVLAEAARAFLLACETLTRRHPSFGGGRLKIHAAAGRLDFHRHEMFGWMDTETWSRCVICSEGLVQAGRAASRPDAAPISEQGPLSLFLFPGAEFVPAPRSPLADRYSCEDLDRPVYLDRAGPDGGAAIAGWWNVIRRVFCGGSTSDALSLIGNAPSAAQARPTHL